MRTLSALVVLVLSGCGLSASSRSGGDFAAGSASEAGPAAAQGSGGEAGRLTAGVWDDSLNFSFFQSYREAQLQDTPLVNFTAAEHEGAAQTQRAPATSLDLVLVIDTTGSMGDEIAWLREEFRAFAQGVATAHPGVPVRLGLVHYRDEGDDYVVQKVDFTSDLRAYDATLQPLQPGGGGDFPEAADQALANAAQLSWSSTVATAKLVFWVADAPPHDEKAAAFSTAVRALRAQGAHLYPVASSGVDSRTEFAMRASAQVTLGRYVFLTDDSGVGGAHLEPTVPCYVVTLLNHALGRIIESELAGARTEVDPAQVIRTVGHPVDGQCALDAGVSAQVF